MPRAAAFCLALMHSLDTASEGAIFDSFCVVCMVETSSEWRERVRVIIVCHVLVDGTRAGAPRRPRRAARDAVHL